MIAARTSLKSSEVYGIDLNNAFCNSRTFNFDEESLNEFVEEHACQRKRQIIVKVTGSHGIISYHDC